MRAQALHLQVHSCSWKIRRTISMPFFRTLAEGRPDMLLVLSSPFFAVQGKRSASLRSNIACRHVHIPGLRRAWRAHVYGADRGDVSATADLRGQDTQGPKPTDLPVEQPKKFEMVVNLKTAKAIGIELRTRSS